jgi:hypothetical protein
MGAWAKLIVVALLGLVVMLSAPVLLIEGVCTASRDPLMRPPAPLVSAPGYARREADSYLSFPEWHIVYAYEDLAAVLARGNESDLAYGRQILAFWRSLCGLTRVVTARDSLDVDTKVRLYTLGWRFTAALALKGAYEKILGRAFEWLRGPGQTAEEAFAAAEMKTYAAFLRQRPWYEYPFGARLAAFWRETPFHGTPVSRKLERRIVVTAEYSARAVAGTLAGLVAATTLDTANQDISTVVVGLEPADAARDPRITVARDLGDGRTLIRTPRHQAYTDLVVTLARRGRDIAEIAGNHRILVTVLAASGPLPSLPGTTPLFEASVQSRPDRRRVGLDVPVAGLAATIRVLEKAGASVERVYDY